MLITDLSATSCDTLLLFTYSVTENDRLYLQGNNIWHSDRLSSDFYATHRAPIEVWQVYLCKAVIKFLQISNLYALISLPMGPSGLDHFDYGYANTLFWEFAGPWGEWKFKNRFDSIPIRVEQQILSRADVLDPRPAASWNHRTEFMSSQR
ncbi:hypothetical protein L207DRAFT_17927 [Hyaloscypha variabilis F]|uniref:Uncharacterized protein n=1 Tax=Hyaloscypha variabilis (strain UAMH 11265 / GT02V1 / F) TaxID=1149755 RepID=A0A2J6SDI4_HYAVF|nr:hypothetical protein L207DRAFT_17927 [Hyaloscypha variabilis F]